MFCNFCGKNFEAAENDYEEISRRGHHSIRCEACTEEGREDEYDWRDEIRSHGSRGARRW